MSPQPPPKLRTDLNPSRLLTFKIDDRDVIRLPRARPATPFRASIPRKRACCSGGC